MRAAGISDHSRQSLFWGRLEVQPSIGSICSPARCFDCTVSAENRHFLSRAEQTRFPQQPRSHSQIQNRRLLKGHEDRLSFPPSPRDWRDNSRSVRAVWIIPAVSNVVLEMKSRWNRKINGSDLDGYVQNANVASESATRPSDLFDKQRSHLWLVVSQTIARISEHDSHFV